MIKTWLKITGKLALLAFLFFQFSGLVLFFPTQTDSANLTSVKDTLSTSRLSFVGAIASATEGSSIFSIRTSSLPGWASSDANFNLFPGETLMVGDTVDYTVDDIVDDANDNQIQLTAGLAATDVDVDDPVIASVSATHVISATTATAIQNGAIRVRIKATGTAAAADDGIPDSDGFDFGTAAWSGDITCPSDVGSAMDFVVGTATASGDVGCTTGYHCFECRYSGVGMTGSALTMTIGSTHKLINPAPDKSSHTYGKASADADTYSVIVENLDNSDNVIDSTVAKVGLTEAVRISATVDPTITFQISSVGLGSTACGVPTGAASTATTVPFGSLSLGSFNNMAQQLSCVTNAASGYAVTVIEDDQLSIGGDGSTEIADTDCDSEDCNESDTAAEWDVENDESGFGYSIEDIDADQIAFQYNATDCSGAGYTTAVSCSDCDGSYCAMKFPSTADGGESALTIMRHTSTPTTTEDIYVCYRIAISTVQTAGDYENYLTYVATATF